MKRILFGKNHQRRALVYLVVVACVAVLIVGSPVLPLAAPVPGESTPAIAAVCIANLDPIETGPSSVVCCRCYGSCETLPGNECTPGCTKVQCPCVPLAE